MPAAIEARDLTKSYGSKRALDRFSVAVSAGSVFALLGPNGAGKTTAVEILEGYRRPDSGHASVMGRDPSDSSVRKQVGVMLQEGGIYPGIKVSEAVQLFRSYYPKPRSSEELLRVAGLTTLSRRKVRTLSGGEKARLNFALALAGSPQILFLDEPTASLDPAQRESVWKTVRGLASEGAAVLLTTHSFEEAEAASDRIGILAAGRLVAEGTHAEISAGGTRSLRDLYMSLTAVE